MSAPGLTGLRRNTSTKQAAVTEKDKMGRDLVLLASEPTARRLAFLLHYTHTLIHLHSLSHFLVLPVFVDD